MNSVQSNYKTTRTLINWLVKSWFLDYSEKFTLKFQCPNIVCFSFAILILIFITDMDSVRHLIEHCFIPSLWSRSIWNLVFI